MSYKNINNSDCSGVDIATVVALSSGGGGGSYTLPRATNTVLGGCKAKPKTNEVSEVAIAPDGKLYYNGGGYNLPVANEAVLGGCKAKPRTNETSEVVIAPDGTLYGSGYTKEEVESLLQAKQDTLTASDTIAIDGDGNISTTDLVALNDNVTKKLVNGQSYVVGEIVQADTRFYKCKIAGVYNGAVVPNANFIDWSNPNNIGLLVNSTDVEVNRIYEGTGAYAGALYKSLINGVYAGEVLPNANIIFWIPPTVATIQEVSLKQSKGTTYSDISNKFFSTKDYSISNEEGYIVTYTNAEPDGDIALSFDKAACWNIQKNAGSVEGFLIFHQDLVAKDYGQGVYHQTNGVYDNNEYYVDFDGINLNVGRFNSNNLLTDRQIYNYQAKAIAKGSDPNSSNAYIEATPNSTESTKKIIQPDKAFRRGKISGTAGVYEFTANDTSDYFVVAISNGLQSFSSIKVHASIFADNTLALSEPATRVNLDVLYDRPVDYQTQNYNVKLIGGVATWVNATTDTDDLKQITVTREADLSVSSETILAFTDFSDADGLELTSTGGIRCTIAGTYRGLFSGYVDEFSDPIFDLWVEVKLAGANDWIIAPNSLIIQKMKDDGGLSISIAGTGLIKFNIGDELRLKAQATSGVVTFKTITKNKSLGQVKQLALRATVYKIGEL